MKHWVLLGMAASAAAMAADKRPNPLIDALAACLPIRGIAAAAIHSQQDDDARRLACTDVAAARLVEAARARDVVIVTKDDVKRTRRSLFGLSIDQNDVFPGQGATVERVNRLDTAIANAIATGNDRWTLVLQEGGRWQTTEAWTFGEPKAGMAVEIRRGALGGYMMRAAGQRTVRVQRVN